MFLKSLCPKTLPQYRWWIILFLVIGMLAAPAIFSNISKLTYSFETGIPTNPSPQPLYGFLKFENPHEDFKGFTFAFDFGAVYLTSKKFFDYPDIYSGKFSSNNGAILYPPIVHYLYNKTFCKFPFPQAALLHLSFQLLLLLLSTFYVLNYYRLRIMFIPVAVIYFILLFLTPVGLSWFERGQFDLYSAIAILFFIFAVNESKGPMFAVSAFFASLKGAIIPFFIQAFIIYLLFNGGTKKFKFFIIFISVILLTLVIFPHCWINCLLSNYRYQQSITYGMTLKDKVPHAVFLLIPALSVLIYLIPLFLKQNSHAFSRTFLPYLTGLGVLNILLPSVSYEYRAVCLVGFIPLVIPWLIKYKRDQVYPMLFLFFFVLFLFAAFHGFWAVDKNVPSLKTMITVYIAYYAAVTVITIINILSKAT